MTDEEKREVWVKVQDNAIHKVYVCTEHPYGVLVEDWASGIPLHYNVPYCNILTAKAPDEQVRDLESENATLQRRLNKALELPCKVGDIIYEVGGQYTKDIVAWTIREIILYPYGARFVCDDAEGGNQHRCIDVHNNEMQTFFDKSPFCLTHTAAENRLKELKEGREE